MLLRPILIENKISFLTTCLIIASQKPVNTKWLVVCDFEMILIFQVKKKPFQDKDVLHPMNHNKNRP